MVKIGAYLRKLGPIAKLNWGITFLDHSACIFPSSESSLMFWLFSIHFFAGLPWLRSPIIWQQRGLAGNLQSIFILDMCPNHDSLRSVSSIIDSVTFALSLTTVFSSILQLHATTMLYSAWRCIGLWWAKKSISPSWNFKKSHYYWPIFK